MMPVVVDASQGLQPLLFQNASAAAQWCQERVCAGPSTNSMIVALWITIGILLLNTLALWYRYRQLKKCVPPEQRPPTLLDLIPTNVDEGEVKKE